MARAARRPSTALRRLTLRPRRAATPTRSPLSRHPSAIVRRPIAARMLRPACRSVPRLEQPDRLYAKALLEFRDDAAVRIREERIVLLSDQYARTAARDLPDWYLRSCWRTGMRSAPTADTREEIAEPFPCDGRTFRRPCPLRGSSMRMLGGREADELRAGGVRGLPCVRPAPLRRLQHLTLRP